MISAHAPAPNDVSVVFHMAALQLPAQIQSFAA